jgi:hypothetical protein
MGDTTLAALFNSQGRTPYPIGVPIKFGPDGSVTRYPGNTIVCHIPPHSPLQTGLQAAYSALGAHPTLSQIVKLVPPASWHMTVLDGVREIECEPGMWPEGLEKKELHTATREFAASLRRIGGELERAGLAPPYKMRVRGFNPDPSCGVGLEVEGVTAAEEQRMRRLRDRLADALGFRAPNHETYQFHITVAYWLRHVEGENKVELDRVFAELLPQVQLDIELGAVEFCTFKDMMTYPRLFYLDMIEEK